MSNATQPPGPVTAFLDAVSAYLPTLVGGLLILVAGIVAGWIVKRALIRVLIWLRLDRLGGRLGWRAALGRGDTRAALYNVVGSAAMLIVVLVFFDSAIAVLGLTMFSRLLDGVVNFLPRASVAAVILGVGLALARTAAESIERTLEDEEFSRSRLFGRLCRAALVTLVVALTLWQLDFARPVVLWGFVITFSGIAVAFALGAGLGSVKAIQKAWENVLGEREDG